MATTRSLAKKADQLEISKSNEESPSDILDKSNINSLINMLPKSMEGVLSNAANLIETKTIKELKIIKDENTTEQERGLVDFIRTSFWYEHKNALAAKREMMITSMYGGICGHHRFHRLMARKEVAANILSRPVDEEVKLQAVINKGFERLQEVLSLPLHTRNGAPDYKLIKEIREIYKMMDMRLNGGIVQKVHQTSLNVNTGTEQIATSPNSVEDIDKQLLEIQKKMNPDQLVINVEPNRSPTEITEATVITTEKKPN